MRERQRETEARFEFRMASNLIIATLENRRAILSKLKAIIIVNLVLYTQQIIN